MAKFAFNHRWVQSVRTDKHFEEYVDSGFKIKGVSLCLRVNKQGTKTYFVRYKNSAKVQKVLSIGDANSISLARAREIAEEMKSKLKEQIDPIAERNAYKNAETFEDLTERFLSSFEIKVQNQSRKPATLREYKRIIDHYLLPAWGSIKAQEVTRRDINNLLDDIVNSENRVTLANRVKSLIHSLFEFGLQKEIIEISPCSGLVKLEQPKPKNRFLTKEEICKIWKATESYPSHCSCILKMLLITGQRPGEVKGMRFSEIKGNEWHLPQNRTKNKTEHVVPLTELAFAVIEESKEISLKLKDSSRRSEEKNIYLDEYVFPSRQSNKHTLWLRTFFNRIIEVADIPHFSPHDLRRTVITYLEELGVSDKIITKIANHSSRGVTERHYMRHRYIKEKREALEKWEACLKEIIRGDYAVAEVFEFKKVVNQ